MARKTDAQQHRSRRGRRYARHLRRDKRDLERRLDNAIAALERVQGEKRRLPRARETATAALTWEANARSRAKEQEDDS